ncbi:MAG: leucyl aminopeptidase family protein [Xanthobacteraceae bacterium]|nr:MAG: leucyl aminopeptidase family protein [Xanthobacteraceae bacterium]
MTDLLSDASHATAAIPIRFVSAATWPTEAALDAATRRFAAMNDFAARPSQHLIMPDAEGAVAEVLFGIEDADAAWRDPFRPGQLATVLPPGLYRFANAPHDTRLAALAFLLGGYKFTRYRPSERGLARLVIPDGVDGSEMARTVAAVTLARNLINTPANDMGPAELEAAARALADAYGAACRVTTGEELRDAFPLVHAVGQASARAPRLIDLTWGDAAHPKLTLVGKGVCFDSGGLDLKPETAMLLMKKDMGGAATVLALARMIVDRKLAVRLRVIIPAVENAVGGRAFRPLDVYPSRKGLTVEVGNTDAEGRLVLADALACAAEDDPDLLIDLGTLTGAARVALGPDLPPFYTANDALAAELIHHARAEHDPLWRLPLWPPYDSLLDSRIANLGNVASGAFAGSIMCALFLQRFVADPQRWLHVDIYGWTPSARPGRPEGGECQAARALFALLEQRYG